MLVISGARSTTTALAEALDSYEIQAQKMYPTKWGVYATFYLQYYFLINSTSAPLDGQINVV